MESADIATSPADLLYEILANDQGLTDFVNDLAQISAGQVGTGGTTLCGILLRREKRNTVVGYSDDEARQMDEIQAGFDEGPCLQAQDTETLIQVTDVHHEARWPDYMRAVRGYGMRSVLAVPLMLGDAGAAAMNFYSPQPAAFDAEDIDAARRHAALASRALTVAARIAGASEATADRRRAMESRTAIDVGIGIIMAQNRCSQDEAFGFLKAASSHRNIKLRELAQDLVTSIGQPAPVTVFED